MKKVVVSFIAMLFLVLSSKSIYAETLWDMGVFDKYNFTSNAWAHLTNNILSEDGLHAGTDFKTGREWTFVFYKKINIESLSYYMNGYCNVDVYFYDESDNLLYTYQGRSKKTFIDNESAVVYGVKKVTIKNVNTNTSYVYLFEFELFEFKIPLDSPSVVYSENVTSINLSWDSVEHAGGYRIYKNNILECELDSSVLSYKLQNLIGNTFYDLKVEAFSNSYEYSNSYTSVRVKTLNYFSGSPAGSVDVDMFKSTLKWSSLPDTLMYEVRLGEGEVITVTGLSYTFENLQMETFYVAYVRQVNLAGENSPWTEVRFTTLGPPERPPYKPDSVKVLSKGQDFIEVEVSETLFATDYKFYLNNVFKVVQPGRIYKFEGLQSDTQYSVSVYSSNQYGDSLFAASTFTKTDGIPVPTVTSASSSFVSGSPSKQNVVWQSKDVEQGFKIYVDGELIKELPADADSLEIDFTELGIDKDDCSIEVVPIDPGGKGYKFSAVTKGTGDSAIDDLIGKMLDGKNIIKRAGLIVLFAIISLLLLFVIALFLFNKMKLNLATNDDTSLEANPDEQIKAIDNKNKFDRDAYFIAKVEESSHAKNKAESFDIKSVLNQLVNGKGKGKRENKYMVKVKGKKVELDKTSFHANKYSDFRKLSSDAEFYQWQNKYNDFTQGSFNRFQKKNGS